MCPPNYPYDNQTLKQIRHERTVIGEILLQLDYSYDGRDLITQILETDDLGLTSTVRFTYDSRGRLIAERRTGTHPYDLAYTYDQGGNRLTKTDLLNQRETVYHYDLEDPQAYQHRNNRLMYDEVFDITVPQSPILQERVVYTYALGENEQDPWAGNVTEIIRKVGAAPPYDVYHTCLSYNNNAELRIVTDSTWQEDAAGPLGDPTLLQITEFRGSGRARYLVRQRDTAFPYTPLEGTTTWSDYDGDEIYGDYVVDTAGSATATASFELGLAQHTDQGLHYFHGDQIGTTRLLTDSPYTTLDAGIYTAFGEPVYATGAAGTRYAYAGTWGYQHDPEFAAANSPFDALHVGHRYYSPGTGRFFQRDPIRIWGGLNVSGYVRNSHSAWSRAPRTDDHR